MATFGLIHGAGDVGWYWHLVRAELEKSGHRIVAPDLPVDDDSAGLSEYTHAVVDALGDADEVIVVGHSFGAYVAPLVADAVAARAIVVVAGMIPAPGETAGEWSTKTGLQAAMASQSKPDAGLTSEDDDYLTFYHDVPRPIADEALRRERTQSATPFGEPWPLAKWPDIPTSAILCTEDRVFPLDFMRGLVKRRLGITPDEIESSHCVALSRPLELAAKLAAVASSVHKGVPHT